MSEIDQKEIVVLGANGQLGRALGQKYPNAQFYDSRELDITDPERVKSLSWDGVRVVINAAAYTNVDGAETQDGRIRAWKVNAEGARNIAQAAIDNDFVMVHISSDYVFDGDQPIHHEDEPASPLSVYGASKAAGDLAVSMVSQHYILRTSWVIGEGNNFVRTMIGLANRNISPSVVADQMGRLTFTSELADAIDHLLAQENTRGVYNVTNDGLPTSWADITRVIFENLGRSDLAVTDITTEEYFAGKTGIAPRPLNSMLALDKLQTTGFKSTNWIEELERYIATEVSK